MFTEARSNAGFFIDEDNLKHFSFALFKKLEKCDRLHLRSGGFLRKTTVLKTTTVLARNLFENLIFSKH